MISKSQTLSKNIFYIAFLKVLSFILTLFLVPLLIDYLSPEKYGVWVTLLSIGAWVGIADLGLGNGLRNKLTEYASLNKKSDAQISISAVYSFIFVICLLVTMLLLVLVGHVNWNRFFNISDSSESLTNVVMVFGIGMLWLLFLRLSYNVFYAYQNNFVITVIETSIQTSLYLSILFLKTYFTSLSLFTLCIVYISIQLSLLLVVNFYVFFIKYGYLKPKLGFYKMSEVSPLLKLSLSFLGVQLVGWFMYMSDNLLITQLFGSKEVTNYNVAFRYFGIIGAIWGVAYSSIWTMTTKSFVTKDFLWIKKLLKVLVYGFLISFIIMGLLYVFSDYIYRIWIGKNMTISALLDISVGFYWCVNAFSQAILSVTNGIGKMKLQLVLNTILSIVNIILAIVLSRYTSIGVAGIPLATAICLCIQITFTQIQCSKILNQTAKGIWNE